MAQTLFDTIFQQFISHPCFLNNSFIPDNPYQRPLRINDLNKMNLTTPISIQDINSNKNLIINKLLLTIYEQDLLFLDYRFQDKKTQHDFQQFYAPEFVAMGKFLRPQLEQLAFHFLTTEIEVIGHWNKEKLINYLTEVIATQEQAESELCNVILNSDNVMIAAKLLLIQMAPDFLSEASAMARMLPGSFGIEQSELMKIFIDEYGYGVHAAKHSSLFENTLTSIGLNKDIHHYFNDYLPTSLMLVNYFHYICANKNNYFKYLGALYYTEASIPHFNQQISVMLHQCFEKIDTEYFDEHVHIDKHHRRMVLEKIIATSIDQYGESIIDDILLGFESFRLLQNLADIDLIKQIKFGNKLTANSCIKDFTLLEEKRLFNEKKGEFTSSHLHSENELFQVTEGELTFFSDSLSSINLKKNDYIFIPKGRLHSTIIQSETSQYATQSLFNKETICDH